MRLRVQTRVDHAISTLVKLGAIALSLGALQLTFVTHAGAQSVGAPDPTACAPIAADFARLACYDRVFRGGSGAPAQESAANNQAARGAAPPANAAAPAATAAAAGAAAANAPAAAPARPAPTPAPAPAEREPVEITIVAVRATQGANSIFTTDQGEVWIQTDGQRNLYPDPPFRAELRPGAMSSYFLDPAERGRAVRVRRRD